MKHDHPNNGNRKFLSIEDEMQKVYQSREEQANALKKIAYQLSKPNETTHCETNKSSRMPVIWFKKILILLKKLKNKY